MRLPFDSVADELRFDLLGGRFLDRVPGIRRQLGSMQAYQMPAGPRAPATLHLARSADAVSEVLVVDAWIPDEDIRRCRGDDPTDGAERKWPRKKLGVAPRYVTQEPAIDGEQGTGRKAARPEILAVGEALTIELPTALPAMTMERTPVHRRRRVRQEWAWRKAVGVMFVSRRHHAG